MSTAPGNSAIFRGGGETGALVRGTDWSPTPLGATSTWSMSLKAVVRVMLNTQQAMCLFWGPQLVNLYNDGFIPILGQKHPSAMGAPAREVWSDAWPVVGGLLTDVIEQGKAVLFNEMLVPIVRDGRLQDAWWNYSYSPALDDDGRVAGVLVVATETTAEVSGRKQLEAARFDADLARHEMQAVFMQAPLPMALLRGPEHRFVLVNAPYRVLVGREVIGKTLAEAFADEEVGYYRPFLDAVYETGEAQGLQDAPLRLTNNEGVTEERFIDVGYHAYRHANGAVVGVLAVIHDVTAKVMARQQETELRRHAEAASLAKDEFLAMVSHELRTPLNAILGWSRLLVETNDPKRIERGLAVIERNAAAQATLIDDILDVSRIISGKVVIDRRRVRLASVVQNAIESIRPAALAKEIAVELELDDSNVELVADEDRLQQIVWNLLVNAVKFTPRLGRIRVMGRREASRVVIRVEDNGRGIEPDFLPHVFDRFRQADASTTKQFAGLGLGLAIVRHLVELHGGTVEVSSGGVGHGATFTISLPIRAVEPDVPRASGGTGTTPLPRPGQLESLAGVRILVVDDEEDARELLTVLFQEAGASVLEASSVGDALAALASSDVDAIVSDIGMPSEDGYTLIQRLRAEAPPTKRELPAIALTAFARAEDRRRALAAGFHEHLSKPVDPQALVRTVAALTRHHG